MTHPPTSSPPAPDAHPHRWRMLVLLALAELLGMALWFSASAVSPRLQALWGLSESQSGWLTGAVQLGFVAGTAAAALLNLADLVPNRAYFAVSALLAAGANAALVAADGYGPALALRFATGVFLAGVYPPAMKMVATWFRSARGLAIGTVVGALTVGKATPYLLRAFPQLGWQQVVLAASAGAVVAAILVGLAYREGPYPFARRPFAWGLIGEVARNRPARLAIAGYLGHMWELYAAWTFVSVFFADYFARHGVAEAGAEARAGVVGFAMIAAGGIGSVLAGRWADRLGRARITIGAMWISGACALVMGWMLRAPAWLAVLVALVWGASVVADSAQFSAIVTEVAPEHAVGTALTLQTALGFLLTSFSIAAVPHLRHAGGWPLAFGLLAVGPALGIAAMRRLEASRRRSSL
ncbi:MFS transporter [Longimicrobium sp.]|uniref:MFS transporter n=1 Tax=Longimicrobium sp. TaxID=2029185 RepID=UPI002E35D635|nr:MFS transporter [Longimicrobium sp.]HEX6041994.1 MFS transporter [Longimicrobium sp.]